MKPDLRHRLPTRSRPRSPSPTGLVTIDLVERRGDDVLGALRLPRARRRTSRSWSRASSRSTRPTEPARAAPASATSRRSTRTCSCRTRRCSIGEGALVPWSVGDSNFYESESSRRSPTATRSTSTPPWTRADARSSRTSSCTARTATGSTSSTATGWAGKRSYMLAFEGIVKSLERRYRETDSATQRERIEEYMSARPCSACNGARLQAGGARRHGRRPQHPRAHAAVGEGRDRVPRANWTDRARAAHRRTDPQGDPRAARVPRQRRRRVPPARPRRVDAVGRRGAAPPARHADRLAAGRRALHPRRAVHRAAPARQRPPDLDARATCAISATPCSSSSTTSR